MKVLICLCALLAVASAGVLHNNALLAPAAYSTAGLIAPTTYVHSAPALQSAVHIVRQPIYHHPISSAVYAAPAPLYHAAPIYRSAPLVSAPVVAAPSIVSAAPIAPIVGLSHSYGLGYGSRYASTYGTGLGGVFGAGFLKRQ